MGGSFRLFCIPRVYPSGARLIYAFLPLPSPLQRILFRASSATFPLEDSIREGKRADLDGRGESTCLMIKGVEEIDRGFGKIEFEISVIFFVFFFSILHGLFFGIVIPFGRVKSKRMKEEVQDGGGGVV